MAEWWCQLAALPKSNLNLTETPLPTETSFELR